MWGSLISGVAGLANDQGTNAWEQSQANQQNTMGGRSPAQSGGNEANRMTMSNPNAGGNGSGSEGGLDYKKMLMNMAMQNAGGSSQSTNYNRSGSPNKAAAMSSALPAHMLPITGAAIRMGGNLQAAREQRERQAKFDGISSKARQQQEMDRLAQYYAQNQAEQAGVSDNIRNIRDFYRSRGRNV